MGHPAANLRQRPEYTQKLNAKAGRHGWLRLTPAYSLKVVDEIIQQYGSNLNILDPFCGTGTTALCAVNRGHNATTVDINPFLAWLARIKTAQYTPALLRQTEKNGDAVLKMIRRKTTKPVVAPCIHNIERWWTNNALDFLTSLLGAIYELSEPKGQVRDLLCAAFCRTLIKLSNATFNHQSMSFGNGRQQKFDFSSDMESIFLRDLQYILTSAETNPLGKATVLQGDARDLPSHINAQFDLVVTSPPYANRMSYIRELRPYMFWLGYLETARDAGELDWLAIGGTWGIATSRLGKWCRNGECWLPAELSDIVADISRDGRTSGPLLASYVAKYCEDMSLHFASLRDMLNPGAHIHYIVGNSTFYGVLVPTEQIYASLLHKYGYESVKVQAIRKRNSNKALIEFDVSATWPGSSPAASPVRAQ